MNRLLLTSALVSAATAAPSWGQEALSRLAKPTAEQMQHQERLLSSTSASPINPSQPESMAFTSLGSVLGFVNDNARGFLGVPYGMSPQNESRWQPPVPAISWSPYIMQSLYDPPGCIQSCTDASMPPHACPTRTSEDCLFLNVWTPRQDYLVANGPVPVLFFIHGGAFKQGYAGGIDGGVIYDASAIVNTTGAIVVATNYRLGALGFLYSQQGTGGTIGGNLGLMDQAVALQWVRDNIAAFGGDPSRITLFGQSAGAMSIASHLTRPQTKGLYNAAVVQSDPFAMPFRDSQGGMDLANVFAKHAGCSDGSSGANWTAVEACLMSLDSDTLLAAQLTAETDVLGSLNRLVDIFVPWVPVYGTGYLTNTPLINFQQGLVNDVPIIIGTVKNEGNLFINFAFNSTLGEVKYAAVLEIMIGLTHGAEVMEQYPLPNPVPSDLRPQLSTIATDALFVCPTRNATASLASSPGRKSPVFLYSYEHVESFNQALWGNDYPFTFCWPLVCHGAELVELFHPNYPQYGTNYTSQENDLSTAMQGYWSNLAASGASPNGGNVPVSWNPYNLSGRPTLLLQAGAVGMMPDYNAVNCDFFDQKIGYNFY